MGFVKRRGNTKSKVSVEHFDQLKELFLLKFNNSLDMDEVPMQLVITSGMFPLLYTVHTVYLATTHV